jgi:hypothetical protein
VPIPGARPTGSRSKNPDGVSEPGEEDRRSNAVQLSHTGIISVPHGVVTATGQPSTARANCKTAIAALSPVALQRLSLPPSLPGAGTSAARSLAAPSAGPVISRQASLAVGCLGT